MRVNFGIGALVLAGMLLLPLPRALAVAPDETLADADLEMRARALSKELRCMVCQNQSIDDSDAPLARDLRVLLRERLQAGDTDQQVLDFLTARYGEFVLLRPRFSGRTAVLWLTPLGILLIGALGLALVPRGRPESEPELTHEEQARVAAILERGDRPQRGG
jgi:cytochrome c-type biogenesis protein CcmH